MQVVRTCATCGALESAARLLITVGDLLDVRTQSIGFDADPLVYGMAFCRSRDCVGAAARAYVKRRLDLVRSGRGVARRVAS